MSNSQENVTQISSEESEHTKPKEMGVDYQNPALHSELASIFKTMVSLSRSTVKLPPEVLAIENTSEQALEDVPKSISESTEPSTESKDLDTNVSKEVDTNVSKELEAEVATPDTVTRRKSRLKTSVLMCKRQITFELPKPCIVDQIDMDKLPTVDQDNNPIDVPTRRFSYRERLEGWSIERRKRPKNGHIDSYYHHSKSSRNFRSVPEVVKFILYEIYPNIMKKNKKQDSDKDKKNETPTMESLCTPTSSGDHKSFVEEFLKDSYNNMVNSRRKDFVEEDDSG